MFVQKVVIAIATDASEAATAYSASIPYGVVRDIVIDVGSMTTPTVTITAETSGAPIYSEASIAATKTVSPRRSLVGVTGSAITDSAGDICVVNERIKVVIASGGVTKTGTITVYLA